MIGTLEIIDYNKQIVYEGKDGFTFITSDYHNVSGLVTDDGKYVVEKMYCHMPLEVKVVDTIEEMLAIVLDWMPDKDKHRVNDWEFFRTRLSN